MGSQSSACGPAEPELALVWLTGDFLQQLPAAECEEMDNWSANVMEKPINNTWHPEIQLYKMESPVMPRLVKWEWELGGGCILNLYYHRMCSHKVLLSIQEHDWKDEPWNPYWVGREMGRDEHWKNRCGNYRGLAVSHRRERQLWAWKHTGQGVGRSQLYHLLAMWPCFCLRFLI